MTGSILRTGLAAAAIFGWSLGCGPAGAAEPKATPAVFTTDNYALTVTIPSGLFRCSYPATWIGSDHGIAVYLSRPKACDPTAAKAAPSMPTPPRVELFYGYNVADVALPGGGRGLATTNVEMLRTVCPPSAAPLPVGSMFLGSPGTGCLRRQGSDVSMTIGALYSQDPVPKGEAPDSMVLVTLFTTRDRYAADLPLMRDIAAHVSVCVPAGRPPQPPRRRCPPYTGW